MNNQRQLNTPKEFSNFIIFKIDNAKVNIDVFFHDETLWLTQKQMAELFEKGRSTITGHLKNIFDEKELDGKVVCRDFQHATQYWINKSVSSKMEPTCKNYLQVHKVCTI